MRNRPAKIDLCLHELAVSSRQGFGVGEDPTLVASRFISHIDAFALLDDGDEGVTRNPPAVRPASLEIGPAVDPIVQRTGEVEVLGDQPLDR